MRSYEQQCDTMVQTLSDLVIFRIKRDKKLGVPTNSCAGSHPHMMMCIQAHVNRFRAPHSFVSHEGGEHCSGSVLFFSAHHTASWRAASSFSTLPTPKEEMSRDRCRVSTRSEGHTADTCCPSSSSYLRAWRMWAGSCTHTQKNDQA